MPKPNPSFYEVLSAAVADLSEHGFDSIERVDRWVRELRAAAERGMMTPESMDQQLRNALAAIYQRLVEKGEIARYHPGIERYTIERIRPKLRAELDRRIMASANLIKLNRAQAIDKTLQRFQGWSTSIPPGGVSAETKAETKKTVRKALASLPFEERRVLIDQGHKLVSAINEIVAADGGAIAAVWRHHHVMTPRPEHLARDGDVFLIRNSWAHQSGLVKPAPDRGYVDEIEMPGQLVYCRCSYSYLYHLRDLPADMLTAKGKASLSEARAMLRANAPGRADAATSTNFVDVGQGDLDAFTEAQALDMLGYLNGLGRVRATPDLDEWNAYYDSDADEVALRAKFSAKDRDDKVRTLLHEAGHRGQDVDRETYEAFKADHLNRLPLFLSIANQTHLRDYERTGEVDSVAAEAFAESYARTMLGMPMPPELEEFWRTRLDRGGPALTNQVEAEYIAYWPNKITRCQRCTMFARVNAGVADNRCTAVAGTISAHGHCRMFEIGQPETPARPAIGAEALRVRLERIRTELETAQ